MVLAVGAATTLAACSTATTDLAPEERRVIEVDEPYANATLESVGAASDLVVRGTVTEITRSITMGTDRTVEYMAYTVDDGSGREIAVYVTDRMDGVAVVFEGATTFSVGDEAIWALQTIDPQFGYDGYVLVSTISAFPIDGEAVESESDAPAASEANELGASRALEVLDS